MRVRILNRVGNDIADPFVQLGVAIGQSKAIGAAMIVSGNIRIKVFAAFDLADTRR